MKTQLPANYKNVSISHATLNPEHLIPLFCEFILEHRELLTTTDRRFVSAIACDVATDLYKFEDANANDDLQAMFDIMDGMAPNGCYFGSHPGDGSDFGFWEYEDNDNA